jgi:hypothetical protein
MSAEAMAPFAVLIAIVYGYLAVCAWIADR